MPRVIDSFTGDYYFLSNFYASPILYKDILFSTIEHLFQALKSRDKKDWKRISKLRTPNEAKIEGRKLDLREDWEEIKLDVMWFCLKQKFKIEPLRVCLLKTGNAQLIEGNTWNDTYWGVCRGVGQNHLGKLEMKLRSKLGETYG